MPGHLCVQDRHFSAGLSLLASKPSMKASQLSKKDQANPIICYLFGAIRPELVFVHSRKPICCFEARTGCEGITSEVQRVSWQGHSFWLFGLDRPLHTLSRQWAAELGAYLAPYLGPNSCPSSTMIV
jgi:hypothetical protein